MDIRCQQFTKEYIANEMLNLLGYRKSVYGKKILENSCGEGNILCLVVERYIKQNAYEEGYSREAIVVGLESDIYGAEIVKTTYDKCIENVQQYTKKYDLGKVRWNIFMEMYLRPFNIKFEYVIRNPLYKNVEKKCAILKKNI